MKILKIAAATAILILLLADASAQAFNFDGGDPATGKEQFQRCRACHNGSKADKLSPSHKTKKQWQRLFKDDFKKLKRKMPEWDSFGFTEADLEHIHRYLSDHALDSDKPQTCD